MAAGGLGTSLIRRLLGPRASAALIAHLAALVVAVSEPRMTQQHATQATAARAAAAHPLVACRGARYRLAGQMDLAVTMASGRD